MGIRGSSRVPAGAEPHAQVSRQGWITWECSHLHGTQLGFPDTSPPEHLLMGYWFFKKDKKEMLFSQHFTYPATPTVHAHLNRTAFPPKLGIIFHSTLTCLSNLARKAVKNNCFFLTCLDPCLFKVLSNNSKWKLSQIWARRGLNHDLCSECALLLGCSPHLPLEHTMSLHCQMNAQCSTSKWQRHLEFPSCYSKKFFRENPFF